MGLYDYAAIVPVVQGAGGVISDWNGNALTLQNHDNSKGRVVACSNEALHSEIVRMLSAAARDEQQAAETKSYSKRGAVRYALVLVAGIILGAIGKPRIII